MQKLAFAVYTVCVVSVWILPVATFAFFLWLALPYNLYFGVPILGVGLACARGVGEAMVPFIEKIESIVKF